MGAAAPARGRSSIAMKLLSSVVGFVLFAALLPAQTSPPAQQPARRPRPKPQSIQVTVRDQTGTPIAYAHVTVFGAVSRAVLTNADGVATLQSMPEGTYRVRFERDGFVALERDITVRNGQPHELDVELSATAEPPPAVQAESPPPTPPPPAPTPAPSGPPVTLSIPGFLDKNFIGRDPLKESVLGCTGAATTRLLQLRDPIAVHTHDQDEILYVIAGDGAVKIRPSTVREAQGRPESGRGGATAGSGEAIEPHDESNIVSAGSLSVIPRGVPHALERRGRNPLIVLSTLAGAPCQSATSTHQASKR